MRSTQKVIETNTTIADTKSDIKSSRSIVRSGSGILQRTNGKRSPQRTVSIIEEVKSKKIISSQTTEISLKQGGSLELNHLVEVTKNCRTTDLQIVSFLQKIFFKKKRYCFQILKQFYLFPDQTQSEIQSISQYDPLVFQEEIIHSLVKIMETRLIANKIWGFLNLKMMPYLKAAIKIQQKVTQVRENTIRRHKKVGFEMIKVAAEDAISAIKKPDTLKQSRCLQINTSYLYSENKQTQCGFDQKSLTRAPTLRSNLIQEQIKPTILEIAPKVEIKPVSENNIKIYTREEYELKYGKIKQRNQNLEPRVLRVASPDYAERKNTLNEVQKNTYTSNSDYSTGISKNFYTETKPQSHFSYKKQETKLTTQIKSPRKYNIIHYHEKPREVTHFTSLIDVVSHNKTKKNCCSSHCICSPCISTCCCEQYSCKCVNQFRSTCFINTSICNHSNFCDKYQKNDAFNQTKVSDHLKFINEPKLSKNINTSIIQNNQLSQLESRIQYLNFLKSLVKEQQMQETLQKS